MKHRTPRIFLTTALAGLGLLVLLTGCEAPVAAKAATSTVRSLPDDWNSRLAASYAGVRGNDPAQAPTPAQIAEDLDLLDQAGFKLLRFFSSSDAFAKETIQQIQTQGYDMKVQLGVWLQGSGQANYEADNLAEIARGVALAKAYPGIVAGVSVGNEKVVSWQGAKDSLTVAQVVGYLQQVRGQITQPVTTDDNWAVFANNGGGYDTATLVNALDYVSIHTYPLADSLYANMDNPSEGNAYWDWFQLGAAAGDARAAAMMDAAIGKAKKDYGAVRDYLDAHNFRNRPIVVGETGWKSAPSGGETMRAHPINQKMYFDRLKAWTNGPKAVFYFEAFDEPWKGGDDSWGLWDVNRKAKYALWDTFTASASRASMTGNAEYYVAPPVKEPIAASVYSILQEVVPEGAATPTGNLTPLTQWIGWDAGPVTASVGWSLTAPIPEGTGYYTVQPVPKTWGWGAFVYLKNKEDLSAFATGHVRFSIKTTYAGALEMGFHSDKGGTKKESYIKVSSGTYGFVNDGAWHEVALPVADVLAAAAVDLHYIDHGLTIADRYDHTGTSGQPSQVILVDDLRWTTD